MENEKLLNLKNAALKEIGDANSVDSLNAVRNTYLSKKSELSSLTSQIGQLPPEERKSFGAALTEVRVAITTAIEEKMTLRPYMVMVWRKLISNSNATSKLK